MLCRSHLPILEHALSFEHGGEAGVLAMLRHRNRPNGAKQRDEEQSR